MSARFQTITPIDNSVYVEREFAIEKQIEKTLELSSRAQKIWRQSTLQNRAQICRKVVSWFMEHSNEIGEELTWQMGRPISYSPSEISSGFQERALYMINIAEDALANIEVGSSKGIRRFIKREALGPVFVLAPWNYPYLTSVNAIIPAIMAGNSVILKHSTQTPLCAERYMKAFQDAGLPDGVFQYLHLTHDQVNRVIKDERISYIAFTGSVPGGRSIQNSISNRFISAGLELGGKDPAYVRADADLENAIDNLADGSFFNSGQSCCGIERIYVNKELYHSFVEGFVALTKTYVLGNPLLTQTTLGPMVRTSAAKYAVNQINEAIQKGAKALIDPLHFPNHQESTPYLAPQVLVDVNHNMHIMQEESFAPIACIMSVQDDYEAVQKMNDSKYGLTASIWTRDIKRAIEIGDQLETGTCFMNRCDYLDPGLAWTGVKESGRGATLSGLGYAYLTRPKSYHLKTN